MKTLLIISTLFLFGNSQTSVYVCISKDAKKFHYIKSCRGLQRCTHEIRQTTIDSAKSAGYTECLIE